MPPYAVFYLDCQSTCLPISSMKWIKDTELMYKYAMCTINIIEPGHEISNNVTCATSKASDQSAHARSLIRAFASPLNII